MNGAVRADGKGSIFTTENAAASFNEFQALKAMYVILHIIYLESRFLKPPLKPAPSLSDDCLIHCCRLVLD